MGTRSSSEQVCKHQCSCYVLRDRLCGVRFRAIFRCRSCFFSEGLRPKPGVLAAFILHAVRVLFSLFFYVCEIVIRLWCRFASVPPFPGPFFFGPCFSVVTYVPLLFAFIYGSVLCFTFPYFVLPLGTLPFLRALPFYFYSPGYGRLLPCTSLVRIFSKAFMYDRFTAFIHALI